MENLFRRFAVVALMASVLGGVAFAAPPAPTTITISDMDCAGCAKRIVAKLKEVANVKDVEANVEAATVKVTAKDGTELSPRDLWEAVEKAKKTPTKLEGPGGTFTEKPKS